MNAVAPEIPCEAPNSLTVPLSENVAGVADTESVPLAFCQVAVIVALPGVSTLSNPPDVTVATAVFEDDHVACIVTSCVVPFDSVAFAVNCLSDPLRARCL